MSDVFLGGVLGYLIGSIPTAFLLVRWKSRVDIRQAGSGNVGTLNSFQVSGSKVIGIVVLLIDVLKGMAAVGLSSLLSGGSFPGVAAAGVMAVLGHNFPVWLRFHGGRGLATAAGVFATLCLPAPGIWMVCWAPGFLAFRSVNVANTGATLALIAAVWITPDGLLSSMLSSNVVPDSFRWFGTITLLIILVRHIEPVAQFVRERHSQPKKV